MYQEVKDRRGAGKWIILVAVGLIVVMSWRFIFDRPSFNPDEVAQAETHMWQDYYSGDKTQLGLDLVSLLRKQHGMSLFEAKKIGKLLASSAMQFRSASGSYERIALPDLTEAYRLIKRSSGGAFDPADAARAELAWWVARRTPGQDSAEQVGMKIAELYAVIYDDEPATFREAGMLRAEAAALRDLGAKNADWERIEGLLRKSYHAIEKAL